MWKKIEKSITLCCAALLVVIATVSGTLAFANWDAYEWSQKTDQTVKISLIQEKRSYGAEGTVTGLEPFVENPQLIPLVQSAQYDGSNFDRYGMPMAEGYVDQIVRVKNEGTADAYVRVFVAIPAVLDNPNEDGHNALHWNLGNRFMPDGSFGSTNSVNNAFDNISWECTGTAVVEGVNCNLYTFTYEDPLTAGSTTEAAAFVGFYLDRSVNVVDDHILLDGVDIGYSSDDVKIHVVAQAVQAYGFKSAERAFATAQISPNPWRDTVTKPYVSTYDQLVQAFNEGWEEIILANAIEIEGNVTDLARIRPSGNQEITLDLNGFTITNGTDRDGASPSNCCFYIENTEFTITGNGAVLSANPTDDAPIVFFAGTGSLLTIKDGTYYSDNSYCVWAGGDGSHVVIDGGHFEQRSGSELIYANGKSLIEINGGFFRGVDRSHLMNEYNNSQCQIIVRGGTFVNFDPVNAYNGDGGYLPDGYKVITEEQENGETWYTVVPE